MSNRKHYRIIIEDPPAGQKGGPGNGPVQHLLRRLPNLEVATRKNRDGTFGVWVRMTSAVSDKVDA